MSAHIGYYNSLHSTYLFIYIQQTKHNLFSIIFPSTLLYKFQNTNHISINIIKYMKQNVAN